MAAFINNDITAAGLIVLAKGAAGEKINYTRIVLGDGYQGTMNYAAFTRPLNQWLRMPGDVVFLVGGIAPFLWIAWLGAFSGRESFSGR